MKIIFLALVIFSSSVWADEVRNLSELALLPPYCRGTQQIRTISKDQTPVEQYEAIYGVTYHHLHHYCWALNAENKAGMISDKYLRESKLNNALGDIKYVLDRAEPDFVLLPAIYNSKARILFALHRDSEAVLALEKAIEIKPDYVPAIARLSDYFVHEGNKAQAIKTLETGIDNTENANGLIKKLAALGRTYQGTPGSALKKEEVAKVPVTDAGSDQKDTSSASGGAPTSPVGAVQPALNGGKPENDPHCRFCPFDAVQPASNGGKPGNDPYCRFCP